MDEILGEIIARLKEDGLYENTVVFFKYIRNFMTDRPYLQPQYRDSHNYMEIWKELYHDGELNEVQSHFVGPDRPAEELYDLWLDPHETNNLVHSYQYEYAMELARHRDILYRWIIETDDKGRFPESDEGLKAVIRRWGERAVNKEYKRVRDK